MNTQKIKINRKVAMLVSGFGLIVAAAWIVNMGWLTTFGAGYTSMKFSTAVCFVITGLLFLSEDDYFRIGAGLMTLMIMGTSLLGLYSWDTPSMYTVTPGVPSLATALLFLIVVLTAWYEKIELYSGVATVGGAALALTGYLIDLPALYYYYPHVSTGMALPTALTFLLLGTGFIQAGIKNSYIQDDRLPAIKSDSHFHRDRDLNNICQTSKGGD